MDVKFSGAVIAGHVAPKGLNSPAVSSDVDGGSKVIKCTC